MKLRTRLLLSVGVTLVCLIVGIYLLASTYLLKSYRSLEQQNTESNMILITALVFSAVIGVVLERSVLLRLSKFTQQVERIGEDQIALPRIVVSGRDELTWLAEKTNEMLTKLEQNARYIRDGEEKLHAYNENLERIVLDRTCQLEAKTQQMQEMNAILENAVEGISLLNIEGRIVMTNIAYAEMFGYHSEEMVGRPWPEIVCPDDHEMLWDVYQDLIQKGKVEAEARGYRQDGSLFYMQMVMIATYDGFGNFNGHYCFVKDISERKALEAQISHQAFHDALTGLPNRALFMDRLGLAQARARRQKDPIAVLFLDLDNFKVINDSLGHESGDNLLLTVAERLQQCVRPGDTVARLGGDEFTILLETPEGAQEAIEVAKRIIEALRAPVKLQESEVFPSVSIGIACSAEATDHPDDLLRDADTAMYQAKADGKSGYSLFDTGMNDRVVERMEMENALRYALERNEFRVHYQPLIDLESGHLSGVEALIRWERPMHGLVQPGKFIPIAEETGLIVPIGYWVLEEACRQAKEWKEIYPNHGSFTVNVNLSGRQLQRTDVVERVQGVLEKIGLDPGDLKLEITESVMMADMEDAVAKLKQLKALGVKLAMDDFGTGYSSMASLNAFPLDTVKIDRAFVNRLSDQPEAVSIVGAIAMLSRALNLDVTAEGVETEEQVVQLQSLGCNIGQGFYFARPLTADALDGQMAAGPHASIKSRDAVERELIEQFLRAA